MALRRAMLDENALRNVSVFALLTLILDSC